MDGRCENCNARITGSESDVYVPCSKCNQMNYIDGKYHSRYHNAAVKRAKDMGMDMRELEG